METYLGQILMTAFDFAPVGFALCDGSLLSIAEFDSLYNLIGTTYGGDGVTTFAVPDLRGRIPVHRSLDPSKASGYGFGKSGGARSVTLLTANLPQHSHAFLVSSSNATRPSPVDSIPATVTGGALAYASPSTPSNTLAQDTLSTAGSSAPLEIAPPALCINFIISLWGVWPSRD